VNFNGVILQNTETMSFFYHTFGVV